MEGRGNSKRGFIKQSAIILIITLNIFLPIIYTSLKIAMNIEHHYEIQDEIGILQLQQYLAIAYDIEVTDNELVFIINEEEHVVKQANNNLMMKPGTLFIMHDIDQVNFYCEADIIVLKYCRNNKIYEKSIWKM